eukprot:gnl/Dysnectes_brevis/2341_a2760_988.p1 GENE.gnl/Dysnectes_brevis/2341_a2760_988~~gnl/Dysnectes_brevis/2341_a2760_988.p1  ORF type:complete len:373 (-),score=72.55 gnl/Dysnectes_brevis/2341_a2760_988:11-1093(-)
MPQLTHEIIVSSLRNPDFSLSCESDASYCFTAIDLTDQQLDDFSLLSEYTGISTFVLFGNDPQPEDIKTILSKRELTNLSLAHCKLQDKLAQLTPLSYPCSPMLTHLDLSHNSLTHIPNLSFCPHLTTLTLHANEITSMVGLGPMKHLRLLDLSSNPITTLEALPELPRLRSLLLAGGQLTALGEALRKTPQLTRLDLRGNPIQEGGLEGLDVEWVPYLTALGLSDTNISYQEVVALKLFRLLTELTLEGTPAVGPISARDVRLALSPDRLHTLESTYTLPEVPAPTRDPRSESVLQAAALATLPDAPEQDQGRWAVLCALPQLLLLDDQDIDPTDVARAWQWAQPHESLLSRCSVIKHE